MKDALILLSLTLLTACQSALSGAQKPVSAGALTDAYEESRASVRSKYDGKEITVRGYTLTVATMPPPDADQGSVLLADKVEDPVRQVNCSFSREQAREFSKIKGGEFLTVKGIFNGEAGAELKFCKLVRVE